MNSGKLSYPALAAKAILYFLINVILVFVPAGTIHYWQGWAFCGIYFFVLIFSFIVFYGKKDLLQEKLKPGPGVKWWDKIFFSFFMIFLCIVLVISSLDATRFKWSGQLPVWPYAVSFIVMLLSYIFSLWAMWINNFFSSRVRIQSDRGQYVIQEGPYRFVRHPGYLGGIFWLPSLSLVLGSLWGLIPAGLAVIAVIIRTYLEDKMLQEELPGYIDYAKKVRFRLIRGIW